MKNFLIVTGLLLSGNAMARGVVVKCWDVGAKQTEENLVFQNDGGYIHKSLFQVEGQALRFHSDESCLSWDLPSHCQERITTPAKTFDLVIASVGDATEKNSWLEPMIGYVHAAGDRAIALSCTRETL